MTSLLIKLFIKDHKNTEEKTVRAKYITLGSIGGIIFNVILFTIKLLAGLIANSVSVIADAFNNLSDMASSVITYIGYKLSTKPADKEHPFGHGRMEYMSASLVSALIILVGFELLKSSFDKIINPTETTFNTIAIIILVSSVLIKLYMFFFNKKLGKAVNSQALTATAFDCLGDVVSTTAVLVSAIISMIFKVNIDAFIGLAVSVMIIYAGIKSIKETLDPLLGMPPEEDMVKGIEKTVLSYDDFTGIHDLIVHNYGPGRIFVSLHVEVPENIDIIKCHEEIDECEKLLTEKFNAHITIHYDPIATNDERVAKIKNEILGKLKTLHSEYSLHDFRIVDGENTVNLIFDVVVPTELNLSDNDVKIEVTNICKELNKKYNPVITVDRNYL